MFYSIKCPGVLLVYVCVCVCVLCVCVFSDACREQSAYKFIASVEGTEGSETAALAIDIRDTSQVYLWVSFDTL